MIRPKFEVVVVEDIITTSGTPTQTTSDRAFTLPPEWD